MSKLLKYNGYSVVLQEVPDEVALAVNISDCPHRCEGCHSEYLWKYDGDYIKTDLQNLINKYKDMLTCVCFMGGDQDNRQLNELLGIVKHNNLKTALYSGSDSFPPEEILSNLDYIKIGRFVKELGGLNNIKTNQKMYRKHSSGLWEDITFWFQFKENK